jgi:hypothetical protein
MMKPIGEMSLGELAAFVCSQLREHGIRVVLSGGACVSIHTDNRYISYDLDFVETGPFDRKRTRAALETIGFIEKGRYYENDETKFYVDVIHGPLAVGSEPAKHIEELKYPTGRLAILSATDCVKDRLAAYYHWNDLQSLDHAILVVQRGHVDLREIRRWSGAEGKSTEFAGIRERLYAAAKRRRIPRN